MGYLTPYQFSRIVVKGSLALLFSFVVFTVFPVKTSYSQQTEDCIFRVVPSNKSGIDFENRVIDTERYNIVNMMNHWNGGGVAIGDYDNDNLPDIIFTGNQVGVRLYKNIGHLKFKDETSLLGLDSIENGWNSGVTMIDVNNDGWKDVYICRRGQNNSQNILLLNDSGKSFRNVAKEVGLIEKSFSTHALFHDIDGNGELDVYLTNNEERSSNGQIIAHKKAPTRSRDRVFLQKNGHFTDVTDSLIPKNNIQQLGLAVCSGDFNWNGTHEFFVSNDLITEDRFFRLDSSNIFSNSVVESFSHISANSMGCAVADVNNDLWPDLYVVDMLADDEVTRKLRPANNVNRNSRTRNFGNTFQLMRNALQYNTGEDGFSETAMLFDLEATDWSWSPLIADFNNDGIKDFFVTTSLKRDLLNLDYMRYYSDSLKRMNPRLQYRASQMLELFEHQPTFILENKLFLGSNLETTSPTEIICDDFKINSNGAAIGDLDLDGDLDLVVNNFDTTSFIYENLSSDRKASRYIQFEFADDVPDNLLMGAKSVLFSQDQNQLALISSTMGFQSCSEPLIHFGVSKNTQVDSVFVIFNDGKSLSFNQPKLNKRYTIRLKDLKEAVQSSFRPKNLSDYQVIRQQILKQTKSSDVYRSYASKLNRLNLKGPIQKFPVVETVSMNEGVQWFFSSTKLGNIGSLMELKVSEGRFILGREIELRNPEEIPTTFRLQNVSFKDFNRNGTLDMIYSGSDAYMRDTSNVYRLRLIEDVFGLQEPIELPETRFKISQLEVVSETDSGIKILIGYDSFFENYPMAPQSQLLYLDNNSWSLEETSGTSARGVKSIALLHSKADSKREIFFCQENSSPQIITVLDSAKLNVEELIPELKGWWQSSHTTDIDGDGDQDIILGNIGRNVLPDIAPETPLYIYNSDLDDNGKIDPLALHFDKKKNLSTLQHRDDLLHQVISLKKVYRSYQSYAEETPSEILGSDFLNNTDEVNYLSNLVLINNDGSYTPKELPLSSEFGSINHISSNDFNQDGVIDLLLLGNAASLNPVYGMADGNRGLIIDGTTVNDQWAPGKTHHLNISGRVTDLAEIRGNDSTGFTYLASFGNGRLELININYNHEN